MHTFLVISAYFAMILVPCACAQWGDYLTADWWSLKMHYRRTAHLSESLLQAIRETRLAAEQARQIAELSGDAFVPLPTPKFRRAPRRRIGFAPRLNTNAQAAITEQLAVRITARLMALSESFRMAHSSTEDLIAAYAQPLARASGSTLRKPPIRSLPLLDATHVGGIVTASQLIYAATPSAEELEALYAREVQVPQESQAA
jgi:hypothetical protein